MKKSSLIILLLVGIGAIYWCYTKFGPGKSVTANEYTQVVAASESVTGTNAPEQSITASQMLAAGINTQQGVLQSHKLVNSKIEQYGISLANQELTIQAVSEIDLVKAFLLADKQVVLISYNQGGNQCGLLYQFITIDPVGSKISKPFGSCLPAVNIRESDTQILLSIPQNNPYLGPDVVESYAYQNGEVSLVAKTTPQQLKQKYSALTPAAILQMADHDGCYVGGVMLDDNSCGSGRKYCSMFKQIKLKGKVSHDANYKILKDFCN